MFQKSYHEAGIASCNSLTHASDMNRSEMERTFARARQTSTARKYRRTNCGMFSRGSLANRNV